MEDSWALVVAPPDDTHARVFAAVAEREHGIASRIWDASRFPADDSLAYRPSERPGRAELVLDGEPLRADSLVGVWWRRPSPPRIGSAVTDRELRRYCIGESRELLRGVFEAIDAPVVNNPAADARAARKPIQLAAARRLGLAVPRTLMSNDPSAITAFWHEHRGDCVYKPFAQPPWQIAETRVLEEDDLADLPKLRHAPVVVQEHVPRGADIRVNVFGDRVFAARVGTTSDAAKVDWRLDPRAEWAACRLPGEVADGARRLVAGLGLRYSCMDFRQTPDGRCVFLDLNPSGQFLFAEIDTGQPLMEALVSLVVGAAGRVSAQR